MFPRVLHTHPLPATAAAVPVPKSGCLGCLHGTEADLRPGPCIVRGLRCVVELRVRVSLDRKPWWWRPVRHRQRRVVTMRPGCRRPRRAPRFGSRFPLWGRAFQVRTPDRYGPGFPSREPPRHTNRDQRDNKGRDAGFPPRARLVLHGLTDSLRCPAATKCDSTAVRSIRIKYLWAVRHRAADDNFFRVFRLSAPSVPARTGISG
jgi:hypothetical protein